ncbi:MAG: ABC transporter ATP-binding protein [Clostridia bacterium]|nr:ABC transporter ATP-binding protein [Clostridia bacterium]
MGVCFENVSFSYPDKPVLSGFSATFPDTGVVCLIGASGCGKTTVLRLLAGLETPAGGTISGCPPRVSLMFQEDRLLPWATVEENVRLVLARENACAASEWLQKVGLGDVAHKLPDELSGGMQRRVALARALAAESDLLLLDEPFTGLDRPLAQEMAGLVREIAQTKPVVMVTHGAEEPGWLSAQTLEMTPLSAADRPSAKDGSVS